MVVIEVRNAELLETVAKEAKRLNIANGAIVSLIGAVDSFTISTMSTHDATKDIISDYSVPAEMTGTGEIANGAAGYPPHARYDRVIATVAFPRVPPAHLEQTHAGALILIPLSFAGRGGLMALLRRDESAGASGRFLAQYGGFMAVRNVPEPAAPKIRPRLLAAARPTEVPPAALTDAHPAAFYLSLCCSSPYRTLGFTPDDHSTGRQTWGRGADGSTFALTTLGDTPHVAAEGPLWATLEAAYTQWRALGQPARDRFGITAERARQWVWLDHPGHVIIEPGMSC
ncbi:MAG: hypothetical protein JO272_09700 [Pseudonocardiales bacterium]|nr:hypothetical protein [Pseudonocardiales bacterium]